MKTNILLLFLIFLCNSCYAQKEITIKIEESWIPLQIYENDELVKNDKKEVKFSYIYIISSGRDTISYYDISSQDELSDQIPIIYVLESTKKTDEKKLLIKENNSIENMTIEFSDEKNTITINKSDTYLLNIKYYNELKNSICNNHNILDLVDLLDDVLGDYSYKFEYLKRISSNKKFKNRNFKIINAKIFTHRMQSNKQDIWNVNYSYNSDDVLTLVTKRSTKNDLSFEKKLLAKKGGEYKYKTYNNVENRFEDNNELTFDVEKNTYSVLQSHFQFNSIKEEISQLNRILYKKE